MTVSLSLSHLHFESGTTRLSCQYYTNNIILITAPLKTFVLLIVTSIPGCFTFTVQTDVRSELHIDLTKVESFPVLTLNLILKPGLCEMICDVYN